MVRETAEAGQSLSNEPYIFDGNLKVSYKIAGIVCFIFYTGCYISKQFTNKISNW